jgi:hypothetical protein
MEEYKYTSKELDFISHIRAKEEIRGAKIRWWEDTKIGEGLQPTVEGPMTILWVVKAIEGSGGSPIIKDGPGHIVKPHLSSIDPETGVWHHPIEGHLSDKVAKMLAHPQAVIIGYIWSNALNRLVTNWMGDDGFLKKTEWERLGDNPLGDTLIGRGKVIKKYIQDDGEHVVDIACWLENMRGYITDAGSATVGLLSRESILKDLQRY